MSTKARLKEHGLTTRSPAADRFHALIDKTDDGCWDWAGHIHLEGYGIFGVNSTNVRAHRYAYELLVGPIPEGLTLDHLCRNRRCVNPAHLEPVTTGENVLRGNSSPAVNSRKTHCKRGHEFNEANTNIRKNGTRRCLICDRASSVEGGRRRTARLRLTRALGGPDA